MALGFVALFLLILLVNTLGSQHAVLTLGYTPTVVKEGEPFMVTAVLRNTAGEPQSYSVRMLVDGAQVLTSETSLDASSEQSFTYTRASPALGTAVRIYAEATNLDTGVVYSSAILAPQGPPEIWMSFSAFSGFATAMSSTSTSTSTMSSTFTLAYYREVMGLSTMSSSRSSSLASSMMVVSPFSVSLTISIILIGILLFLELTNPSYTKVGGNIMRLRSKYGLLAVSLFLVFAGTAFTRIVMAIS